MIKGIGASDGIRIGKVFKFDQVEPLIKKTAITDVEGEIAKFQQAIKKSEKELTAIMVKTETSINKETAEIFGAHIEILNDPELFSAVKLKITSEHINSDFALKEVSDTFVAMFEAMDNEYFRERAADIKDVTKRVIINLQGLNMTSLSEISEEVIVVSKDLTPSDTAQLNRSLVKGFITDIGGRTSHSAIMARTLEIPAVVGSKNAFDALNNRDTVILDGLSGEIYVNPSQELIHEYEQKIIDYQHKKELWETYRNKASQTKDGRTFEIGGNIGNPEDLENVLLNGGESIGLYRTEFLYMGKSDFPNEEEQFNAYKKVLEGMGDKPVVIRTLDIGGDKELSYMEMDHELNPFLGNRALRLCLNKPEIFKTQLRALLRASAFGNLHIMFPMIATLQEFRTAKSLLNEVKDDLISQEIPVSEDLKIGIMIEIPAAAINSDILAKEVDFFSIGTNDLIQYTFAADRMNEKVSYLYQPFNPALLKLISMVIKNAHAQGKWVGMCGEMAGEVKALPLLIGLGLDEFSMSASSILQLRYLSDRIDSTSAKALAQKALTMESQEDVITLVEDYLATL